MRPDISLPARCRRSLRRLSFVCIIWFISACAAAGDADAKKVTFEGTKSEHKWTLNELSPDLPADWSPYEYLVMEFKASSPQRFFLWLYDAAGPRRLVIQPFGQNVWMRASMPLAYFKGRDTKGFDLASANNRPQNSFFMNIWGPFGTLNNMRALGVTMDCPVGKPTLEIRSVSLAKEDPGSDFLEKLPVIDEFGQWIHADWPGKIKNLDRLKQEWADEEKDLGAGAFNRCKYGGFMEKTAKATGFFRVEQIEGKWWFVDPDGHLFFSTGVNCVGNNAGTQTQGREKYFTALPPADLSNPARPPSAPIGPRFRSASFYTWNLQRRFGADWQQKWLDMTLRRMDAWGLNTIGNWSDQRFYTLEKKPYVVTLRGWGMETGYLGMPDVYSEDWAKSVDQSAERQCTPRKDDPYLLGYFVGNEPPWPGRENDLVSMILSGNPTPIQKELKAFLEQGDTPQRRKEFAYKSFEKYLGTINAAIRRYDPNHLNLGIRFGGHVSDEILRAGRLFDVNSINIYDYEPTREIKRAYVLSGRPVIIGEFHNGVPADGLGAGLVQVRDQKERGVAYSYYVEQSAALPELIGLHWFQWLDEPVTGRRDGENYNIGFIDVTDRPYKDFIEGVKKTHKRLFGVHSGATPPSDQKAKVQ
jgi:hypothetical protein